MKPLWPHQEFGLAELDRLIAEGERNIVFTLPTGGGKTRVMFEHLTSGGVPSEIYTDRRMLLSQLAEGLDSHGIHFGFRAAGQELRLLEDIQLAMAQTEGSRVLSGKRDIHAAKRIYIDEAHKNAGDTMQQLIAKHTEAEPDRVTIWITATPLGLDHVADVMIVAGTNSELRNCGAIVPAYHYGPDEPDTKWIGKVAVGEGECGLATSKRMEFAHRVFGSVVEHYIDKNPDQKPALLFAPGVKESIWFAEELNHNGIRAAHIDGSNIWLDGETLKNTEELRNEIADRHKAGDIKVVCNRFVLREGIDWPWVYHGILATIYGSLTAYIQSGGRLLRAFDGKDRCIITDHGGNWHRHGSLNADREWELGQTDKTVAGVRERRLREKKELEPIHCPNCHAIRQRGDTCYECGHRHTKKSRMVLQKNGTLREMSGDIFRKRRVIAESQQKISEWCGRIKAVMRSEKPSVRNATVAQVEVWFARDNNWQYPSRDFPMMPVNEADYYRPVKDVTEWTTGKREMATAEAEGW